MKKRSGRYRWLRYCSVIRQYRIKVYYDYYLDVYNCLSRVVDRRFIFGEAEKEMFVQFLREYEQFCGVQVLTFCVMSNHFHALVEVPKRPEKMPDGEEVLRRLKSLSGAAITAGKARQMLAMFAEAKDEKGAADYLAQFHRRMWDVSEFIKLLKQRFTQWYNGRMDREAVEKVLSERGRVGVGEYLHCRVRYFSDGVALGSREFVDGVFGRFRNHFSPGRSSGARRMRGLEPELFTARDLRVDLFGIGDAGLTQTKGL